MTYKHHLLKLACIVGISLAGITQSSAVSHAFYDRDGPTLIWVTMNARGGEGPWEACRRKYQRDVFQVAGGPGRKVRCRIDHSRLYSRGEVRQNFNN